MASMTTGSSQTDKKSSSSSSSSGAAKSSSTSSSSSSTSGEDEFLIAADLTLYANPLRCLQPKKSANKQAGAGSASGKTGSKSGGGGNEAEKDGSGHHHAKGTSDQSGRYDNDSNTMIAADLIKYGSPLDG